MTTQIATYGISATDGSLLADGLGDECAARDVAQMAANMRSERVWLYREGDPSPAVAVEPQSPELLTQLAAMRVKYGPSAALPRTGIRCPRCCALQHERGVCAHEFHGQRAAVAS